MVNIGDKIKCDKGTGIVTDITKRFDERYCIVFRDGNKIKSVIEGDEIIEKVD